MLPRIDAIAQPPIPRSPGNPCGVDGRQQTEHLMTSCAPEPGKFLASISTLLPGDRILLAEKDRAFYSRDFSEEDTPLGIAVLRPHSAQEISRIVKAAGRHGISIVARGGGMSYTKSHTPGNPHTAVLDMGALNSIVKIDTQNRYAIVEPGVTWNQLREALRPTGYRVPYLGTLSGMIATVGGGASQNATGMGRMTLAEHVVGLEVVLGNGDLITTGSSITRNTLPFYRYNGPDFTGMFLCDSGALGIKTKIFLHLEPSPCASYGCVAFQDRLSLVRAQREMAQANLHTEAFAFDEYFVEVYARHPSPGKEDVRKMLASYWAAKGTRSVRGAINLVRAWHPRGLGFLAGRGTVMYYISEGHDLAAADRARRQVDAIVRRNNGKLIPTTIPFALRHGPFLNIGDMMTNAQGEVNFPVNAKFAASQAELAMSTFLEFLESNKAQMAKFGVRMACNTLLHGHFFGLEPVVFWKKPLSPYRAHFASDMAKEASATVEDDAERTAYATSLRYRLAERFRAIGALHVQWGKVYSYADSLATPELGAFVRGIKALVDPRRVINPGSLGL